MFDQHLSGRLVILYDFGRIPVIRVPQLCSAVPSYQEDNNRQKGFKSFSKYHSRCIKAALAQFGQFTETKQHYEEYLSGNKFRG